MVFCKFQFGLAYKSATYKKSMNYVELKMIWDYIFFLSNQGQDSALKVAYIFKVFGAQSFLMVA